MRTSERDGVMRDEFDVLLDDVLREMANPELPERVRVRVETRVWVREGRQPAVVFRPEVFLARMEPRRDRRSTGAAALLHVAAIGLLFWAVSVKTGLVAPKGVVVDALVTPPPMAPAKTVMGGGGGQRGATPVSAGHLPKFADVQVTPPRAPALEQPKIRMPEATVEVQKDLKMANSTLPEIGLPNSPRVGSSLGNGLGTGIGSGYGSGVGDGAGGNYGGGLRTVGSGVSTPVLIHEVEPEFSEEARKAKFQGNVMVTLVVDPQGLPRNVRVLRGVGMGLDQKALEAVRQYRFRPAIEAGRPVAVQMNVEVEFLIF